MQSVIISDEAFGRLAKCAAARNVTIEQLILKHVAENDGDGLPAPAPTATPIDDWKKNFDA
jgi:hypothetical protein